PVADAEALGTRLAMEPRPDRCPTGGRGRSIVEQERIRRARGPRAAARCEDLAFHPSTDVGGPAGWRLGRDSLARPGSPVPGTARWRFAGEALVRPSVPPR